MPEKTGYYQSNNKIKAPYSNNEDMFKDIKQNNFQYDKIVSLEECKRIYNILTDEFNNNLQKAEKSLEECKRICNIIIDETNNNLQKAEKSLEENKLSETIKKIKFLEDIFQIKSSLLSKLKGGKQKLSTENIPSSNRLISVCKQKLINEIRSFISDKKENIIKDQEHLDNIKSKSKIYHKYNNISEISSDIKRPGCLWQSTEKLLGAKIFLKNAIDFQLNKVEKFNPKNPDEIENFKLKIISNTEGCFLLFELIQQTLGIQKQVNDMSLETNDMFGENKAILKENREKRCKENSKLLQDIIDFSNPNYTSSKDFENFIKVELEKKLKLSTSLEATDSTHRVSSSHGRSASI